MFPPVGGCPIYASHGESSRERRGRRHILFWVGWVDGNIDIGMYYMDLTVNGTVTVAVPPLNGDYVVVELQNGD